MLNTAFPDTLLSSSDFGGFDLVLSPSDFETETENCKESFGPDFEPRTTEWDLVDAINGVYSTVDVRTADGKTKITTLNALATWSALNGSYALEEIDA